MFNSNRIARAFAVAAFCAVSGFTSTITSGSIGFSTTGSTTFETLSLTGSNFSINGSRQLTFSNEGFPGCLNAPTCTYNVSLNSYVAYSNFSNPLISSLTYNGVTYPLSFGNYTSTLTLTILAAPVTVPATTTFDPISGFPLQTLSSYSNVPFNFTASLVVTASGLIGGGTVINDTITGSGIASGFGEANTNRGDANSITYQFLSTPEPATAGLVSGALLLAGWLKRRKR